MATSTPWGTSQICESVIRGILWVSTASHGGFLVSPKKLEQMPEYMRLSAGNWRGAFEEDINMNVVLLYFRQEFIDNESTECYANGFREICANEEKFKTVVKIVKDWLPDIYEKYFGVVLQEGESRAKDEQIHNERYKNNFVLSTIYRHIHLPQQLKENEILVIAKNRGTNETKKIVMSKEKYEELLKTYKNLFPPILDIDSYPESFINV